MIFHDCEAVKDGKKTQTRRVKGKFERLILVNDMKTVTRYGRMKWQVGRTYAVQPSRSKPAVGRFELLDIREEGVRDISEEDAKAEGARIPGIVVATHAVYFTYRFGFEVLWDRIWRRCPDLQWKANPPVWVLIMRWVG